MKIASEILLLTTLVLAAGCGRGGGDGEAPHGGRIDGGFVLHSGEGEVLRMASPTRGRVVIQVDPEKTGSPHMAMGIQELEGEIPLHLHEHEEEILFVHSGEGIGTLGDKSVAVRAGSTIYVPPGTWHGLRNTGEKPAQILWVVTPGTGQATMLEKFFRKISGVNGAYPKPLAREQMAAMMREYGMQPGPE